MGQPNSQKVRNPKWHRDEAILALDLYFKLNRRSISADNPEIIELSRVLNKLPIFNRSNTTEKFRNPNGVSLKLCNFLAIDPSYEGKGMRSYSTLDYSIFHEFVHDKELLSNIASHIRNLVNDNLITELSSIEDEDCEEVRVKEGQTLYKYHKYKERNRAIIIQKKKQFLNKNGRLFCEICGFDYSQYYGDLGKGFIECHHILPLSIIGKEKETRLEDLSLVCANCHRMLHRKMGITIEVLREIIHERR